MADTPTPAPYDVIVIGSGPGGYTAAIRAAQLGMRTAIIEKYSTLGGTCLNVGCIPSKALLDSTEHYFKATHEFKTHGIEVGEVKVNFPQMIARKRDVVSQTVGGVAYLMKKNKIDVYFGVGSFLTAKQVQVAAADGKTQTLESKNFIIATGSKPSTLPGVEVDWKRVITSTEALELQEVPKTMIVIGGGIIGMEMGSVFARLGTQITVLEFLDGLIPTMDRGLGRELERILRKVLGFTFFFNHKVQGAATINKGKKNEGVQVKALDKEGKEVTFEAEYCLVAVGRKPYTEGLALDKAGLQADERGRVGVDEHLQTTVPGIYAIGDVVKGAMLAHKASEEGVFVAEHIAGQHPHINYNLIPGVVYTWPEVAAVGQTEEELKAKNIPYKTGSFPFKASGRARASMDTDGFVKVLAHKDTDEILGVHTIGPRCADLIAEAVAVMEYRGSAEDMGIFSHAHPTFSENMKEAALAATENRALNI